jgi:hypothetical protein
MSAGDASPATAALRGWLVSGAPPRPRGREEASALADHARSQGLAGLLSEALEPAAWPAEIRDSLCATRRSWLFRGVQQLDALAYAADRLAGHGLRSLPLKGAALAEDLYGSVADRPMCDVDLLALDDFGASRSALDAAGFRLVDESDHAVALIGDQGVILELHESVTSCRGLFRVPESLWARSRECQGQVRRVPSREDLLIQLGLHGAFQHGLGLTLIQHLDLRRLLEQPLAPDLVAAIADETRAGIALALSLQAAATLVGARVPDALQAELGTVLLPKERRWLREWLSRPERALAPAPTPLLRLRWMAARGRRLDLISGTLLRHPSERPISRFFGLAGRFGVPALRQLVPALRRPNG